MMRNIIIVSCIALLASCKKDVAPVATCTEEISYATQVEPIVNSSCATSGCHNSSAAGGYDLSSHSNVSANAEVILSVINHESGVTPMPLGGTKLADSIISNFNCWIEQGKLNN